ncbi:neurofilament medium polypeptide-like [Dermacentor silvarum]|uniref:neurofilament medium polypeptide-like n=1 Tax=Dermacentor silvarum TaxID=543639 RepID=UPI0021013978|nr:neurofilament medium polypeptide-like [Dermacentor silvarum]
MFQGADMSGALSLAVPDHVVADGARLPEAAEEKKEVGQEHVQVTSASKKPRLSVQAMLFQNIALPISPTDGGVLSDMFIRVSGAPNPALTGQREEVAGTELGVGLGELKDVTGKGKEASVKEMQGQQGLREPGEPKPTEPLAAGRGGQRPGRASPKPASSPKSITAGSSKPHRAKQSKHKHAAGKNPDQRRKQALYKPTGALVPVDIDAPPTRVPPNTENLQQGVQSAADSASVAQEHIPEATKAKRKSVGQDNETPSKRSSKSLDSAGKASTVRVPASHVEEKPQGRTVIGTEVPRATSGNQQVHLARVDLTAEKESKQKRQKKEKKQKKGRSRAISPS